MKRLRFFMLITTILIVGAVGVLASYYARGYRLDPEKLEFSPNGLLVANSEPTGAQVFINGELKTATDATIPLAPGIYDLQLKKEGFLSWYKRIAIEKEIVTQVDVSLFSSTPSLSAVTFSGAFKPLVSHDSTKIAYGVPTAADNKEKEGLWILETVNLPLGFNREPRRVTDGDLSNASWEWSPDSREILLTTTSGIFLLPINDFTPQNRRVNISSKKAQLLADWQVENEQRLEAQVAKLPIEYQDILKLKAKDVVFSPNENKILYTATDSAHWEENLVKQLPGSSTQKQERNITKGSKYVYDIKEDRNFAVGTEDQPLYWFPTSHHLVVPEQNKISIMDYDGTNQLVVYSGSYEFPHAFPVTSNNRLLMLTNFGASENVFNLYSLSLK